MEYGSDGVWEIEALLINPLLHQSITSILSMPPQRQLSLVSATALVVASMVGSGVFTTSGYLLDYLHTPGRVLVAWLVGGIVAMLGALCYGALARRFPESGGEYIFLARTLHPAAGYLAGWVSLLVGFSAPLAAVSLAFGEYLKDWVPRSTPRLTGSCLLLIFAGVHAVHIQRGAWVQNIAVLVKLLLIALFMGLSVAQLEPAPSAEHEGFPIALFAVSLVWISFSYSGWNAVIYIAGEVRDPERNLPRSMLLGTAMVMLLYVALNAVFVYAVPVDMLSGKLEVARIAANALGGAGMANFVTSLIALALATSVSSMLMAGPRVYARMADDGYLPSWLRFPASGPPRTAIILQTALALAMLWSATFQALLTYIGFTLGLCTAGAVAGLVRLRLQQGASVRVPGWPWVPMVFLVVVLAVTGFAVARRPQESVIGLATILAGLAAWRIAYGKRGQRGLSSKP
jgi:APA family basic amino acid/polyamine antiporter